MRQALGRLRQAETHVAPGSQSELAHVENKTDAHAVHLDTMVQLEKAYLGFDFAFRARAAEEPAEFIERLDHSLDMFREAHRMSIATARKFGEVIDGPSDLGVLDRMNVYMIDGADIVERFIENIDDFHHGLPYLNPVPFEKVFEPLPRIKRGGL